MKRSHLFIMGLALTGLIVAGIGVGCALQASNALNNAQVITSEKCLPAGTSSEVQSTDQSTLDDITPVMTISVVETPGFDSPGSVVYLLPSNPTTGYQWEVISKEGLNVEETYIPSNSAMDGAGGLQKFTITSDKSGTYTFKAVYKRSWDETALDVFEQEITLNPENKDETLELNFSDVYAKAGDIVKITVEGNPTTGYEWSDAESEGLTVVKSDYVVDDHEDGMTGVPGTYVWYVTADKPGKYTFSIEYGRPWENTFIGHASFDIIFS